MTSSTPAPETDGSSPRQTKFPAPMPMTIDPEKSYQATISTSMGDMVAYLYPGKAPKTVNNFVNLARYHYYDGLVFHRVISGFMIQGGCPEGSGRGGPGYRFEDELPQPRQYEIGSLAMANAGPNTNGSQFFITEVERRGLDPNYTIFGKCADGDVVKKITHTPTEPGDRPKTPVVMTKVAISKS